MKILIIRFSQKAHVRMMSVFIGSSSIAAALLCGSKADANNYDMYRADYAKGAFCSAIAGACASDTNPENSFFQNPASLESSELGLVYDADYNPSDNTEPGMKVGDEINDSTYMGGVGYASRQFGFAFSVSGRTSTVKSTSTLYDDNDLPHSVNTTDSDTALVFNFPLAYRVSPQFSVGISLFGMIYSENIAVEGASSSGTTPAGSRFPLGFSAGAIYAINKHWRIGSWLRTPLTYSVNQNINYNAFGNSIVYNETVNLHDPFLWAGGLSLMPWGDSRTIFFDLDVIGTTLYGYERTLDTFEGAANDRTLRAKGRETVVEPHLAWRSPFWAGSKGTYSAGLYYETSRWRDLDGRAHGVAGVSYNFGFLEPLVTVDVARDFLGLQISFR